MTDRISPHSQENASQIHQDEKRIDGRWFPGRWIGGTSLVLGPLLLLCGVILRLPYHFFFPQQLEAFESHPGRITAAYSLFVAGNVILWPAVATLAQLISGNRPGWALWGGTLATLGLFARTFHAGADHLAFQLVRTRDLTLATQVVGESYGAFHIFHSLSPAIMSGWIVLAIGGYLSGTVGLCRSIALGLMAAVPLGVLKGTSAMSVIGTTGLCVAFLPLGFQVLLANPRPSAKVALKWIVLMIGLGLLFVFLGELG